MRAKFTMFVPAVQPRALNCTVAVTTVVAFMLASRSLRTAVLGALLASATAWARAPEPAHPGHETEVFTGGEETAQGATPRRPALAYWKLRLTVRVPSTERPVRVGRSEERRVGKEGGAGGVWQGLVGSVPSE